MEPEDPWDEDGDDERDAEILRADRPFGAELRGTTAEEALAGESLEQELAEERPERPPTDETVSLLDDGVPGVEGQLVWDDSLQEDGSHRRKRPRCRSATRRPAPRITTIPTRSTTTDVVWPGPESL